MATLFILILSAMLFVAPLAQGSPESKTVECLKGWWKVHREQVINIGNEAKFLTDYMDHLGEFELDHWAVLAGEQMLVNLRQSGFDVNAIQEAENCFECVSQLRPRPAHCFNLIP